MHNPADTQHCTPPHRENRLIPSFKQKKMAPSPPPPPKQPSLTEAQQTELSTIRDLWRGKTMLVADGDTWTAEARQPQERRKYWMQQLELAQALRQQLEGAAQQATTTTATTTTTTFATATATATATSKEIRQLILDQIPTMNRLVSLTEALEGKYMVHDDYQEYNVWVEAEQKRRSGELEHAKAILKDQIERIAHPYLKWPMRTEIIEIEEAAVPPVPMEIIPQPNNNFAQPLRHVVLQEEELMNASIDHRKQQPQSLPTRMMEEEEEEVSEKPPPPAFAAAVEALSKNKRKSAPIDATFSLKKPKRTFSLKKKPNRKQKPWEGTDLRSHVLAMQERLEKKKAKKASEDPPYEPIGTFGWERPSNTKKLKKDKKKRRRYEGQTEPPQQPEAAAAAALEPDPVVEVPVVLPDPTTSTSTSTPRNGNSKNPPRSLRAERSPPDDDHDASVATSTSSRNFQPDTVGSTMSPMPFRRSRRSMGPKKCHNCKTYQPNYLKCQYLLATGCKCGKHYCMDCLESEYKKAFDAHNTDAWQYVLYIYICVCVVEGLFFFTNMSSPSCLLSYLYGSCPSCLGICNCAPCKRTRERKQRRESVEKQRSQPKRGFHA
jgi:hypothetical protein